ncbi:hypothetical protein [Polymorphospora rubra]|uniref:Uncharacterized protein n=1 Tax=Polymorphospora rubra TaxID=338584 RepID=A0A810N3G1_9ACTN|nr:hypothetical protein [Polymorphospora rubra]BCJ66045.1 hypothetical protein Prubr_30660 [Polymorphospora rubra]
MSRWFQRAVGTVGVAGGFLLLTGGAAQAEQADPAPQTIDPQQVQSRDNGADAGSREAAPNVLTGQLPDLADVPVDRLLAGELRLLPGLDARSDRIPPAAGATADAVPAMVTSTGEQVPALIGDALMAQKPELFGGTESLPVVDTLPVVGGIPVVGDLTHGGVPLVGSLPLIGDPANLVAPPTADTTSQPATTQPATTRPAATQPPTTQPSTGATTARPATGSAPSTTADRPARTAGERSFNGTGRPVAGEDPDYTESTSTAPRILPALDAPRTLPAFDGLQTLPAQGGRPATSTVAPMVMSIDRTPPVG